MTKTEVVHMQDHADLAEWWGDLLDWPTRLEKEGPFLLQQLSEHQCHRVFDSCLGDGVDSIYLLQRGFSVISNESDPAFLKKALKNGAAHGVTLQTISYDWRALDQYVPENLFDSVLCLGNSFTYLFEAHEREQVLENFRSLLKPGGLLLIDERNYPYMLANREKILNEGASTSPKQVIFCGKKVVIKPVVIEDSLVVMHYRHKQLQLEGRLSIYPFKKNELRTLLEGHFEYRGIFSDFEKGYDAEAGFYQHICLNRK
ncbi:MAG: class I SAM-dependent methyltransferase [Verrucomicrobiota bacterium]|nr:class I SAM-dependent methyltransferase [Verrucomicrobiota bacterium]